MRGSTRQAVACKRGEVVFSSIIVYASDYLAGCQIIDMSDPGDPVWDLAGRRLATVADAVFEPGRHAVRWDGEVDGGKAASGTYFFSVTAGNTRQSVKAVLLK